MRLTPALVALAALSLHCSAPSTPAPVPVCAPGRVESCPCASGRAGAQTCNATGSGFEACVCPPAAGGEAGGGSAAAGGATGGGAASAGGVASGGGVVSFPTCGSPGAPSCGANGVCVNTASGPACSCATGYAGLACNQCSAGYQDNDGNGSCLPSCATAGLFCTNHGTCSEASGTATCVCQPGSTGMTCSACAMGFQDEDGDGACRPACAPTTCSGHGACSTSTGSTVCACAPGYSGPACASCAAGFQDNDRNGTCEPSCTSTTCGSGTCADTSGTATCTCTAGHTGATCASCAAGFQDNDRDGLCKPTCATAGLRCTATSSCSDATGLATCACVAGFTSDGGANDGSTCAWSGVLRDKDLVSGSASAWLVDGGVRWQSQDSGVFVFSTAQNCTPQAAVTQTGIMMPPATTGVPLALTYTHGADPTFSPTYAFRFGNQLSLGSVASFGSFRTSFICLGDGALGGPVDLEVRPAVFPVSLATCGATTGGPVSLESFDVVPAPQCPPPGDIVNGNFEAAGGWIGTGFNLVRGFNLTTTLLVSMATQCDVSTVVGAMSVPSALTSPAVRFTMRGTGGTVDLATDLGALATLPSVSPAQSVTVCLPPALRGASGQLRVSLSHVGVASCAQPEVRSFEFDDFRLVSDTACGAPVLGGSFEGTTLGSPWVAPVLSDPSAAVVSLTNDAAQAHGGVAALQLSSMKQCGSTRVLQVVTIPPAAPGAGPVLRFWYRRPTATASNATIFIQAGSRLILNQPLPQSAAWQQQSYCLPAELRGAPLTLNFTHSGTGTSCGTATPTESTFIDDVEVTTDPSCPLP